MDSGWHVTYCVNTNAHCDHTYMQVNLTSRAVHMNSPYKDGTKILYRSIILILTNIISIVISLSPVELSLEEYTFLAYDSFHLVNDSFELRDRSVLYRMSKESILNRPSGITH
jgi:hypothetical protein